MKPANLTLILCATGLVVGGFAGRVLSGDRSASPRAGAMTSPKSERRVGSSRGMAEEKAAPKRNFASLVRDYHHRTQEGDPNILRELERMEDSELKDYMNGLLSGMLGDDESQRMALSLILKRAAAELYRRDPDAAMAWARAGDPPMSRRLAMFQVLGAAMRDNPVASLGWFDEFSKEYGRQTVALLSINAVLGATERGADEVVKLHELYKGKLASVSFPFGPLPEGFDYHRLVSGAGELMDVSPSVRHWAAKDKEAAWKGVKETMDAGKPSSGGRFGALFYGVAVVEGEEAAAKWMARKLGEVPAAKRDQAINSLVSQDMSQSQLQEVMKALPSEADREALVERTFHSIPGELLAPALMELGSEEARKRLLLSSVSDLAKSSDRNYRTVELERFSKVMDEIGMSEAGKAEVRKAMGLGE